MRKEQKVEECQQHLINCLSWRTAKRDDVAIAKELYETKTMDAVYMMGDVTLVDELFHYIHENLGLLDKWERIQPNSIERVLTPFFKYLMVYLLKIVYGILYLEPVSDILFKNEALMTLVGFNAYQIKNGSCKRGKSRLKNGEPSAPICVDTLADNITKLSHQTLESIFNEAIAALAAKGAFPKEITGIIDTSFLPTTKNFSGCGKTVRKKEVWDWKGGKKIERIEEIFGFKVAVLVCKTSNDCLIPIGVKFGKIEEADNSFTRGLIKEGIKNLKGCAKITKILIDRGFLDGEDLWWFNEQGIKFIVPAKENMAVVKEVHELAKIKDHKYIFYEERMEKVRVKDENGKTSVKEEKSSAIGVRGITCYDAYGLKEHSKNKNRKDFKPNPINAIWVTAWAKRPNQKSEKGPVYLTNMEVNKPMKILDGYNDRSLIENGIFRTGKQDWHLNNPPKNRAHAFKVHVYLTFMIIALTTAFREYKIKEEEKEKKGIDTGIGKYRRKIVAENMDKVVVFIGFKYGIFRTYEMAVIMGGHVKDCEKTMGINYKEIIYQKYRLAPF